VLPQDRKHPVLGIVRIKELSVAYAVAQHGLPNLGSSATDVHDEISSSLASDQDHVCRGFERETLIEPGVRNTGVIGLQGQ